MTLLNLFVSVVLLLLACQAARGLPVNAPATDSCVAHAHTLLWNISYVLAQNHLFSGIDCRKQSVKLHEDSNTPAVCAPKEAKCAGIPKSEFNPESCLRSIGLDLNHYYTFLAAQPDPDALLRRSVLFSLRELMENCFTWSAPAALASQQASRGEPSTYDERLSLCKVLKGFQVRSVTISRVLAYMKSADLNK